MTHPKTLCITADVCKTPSSIGTLCSSALRWCRVERESDVVVTLLFGRWSCFRNEVWECHSFHHLIWNFSLTLCKMNCSKCSWDNEFLRWTKRKLRLVTRRREAFWPSDCTQGQDEVNCKLFECLKTLRGLQHPWVFRKGLRFHGELQRRNDVIKISIVWQVERAYVLVLTGPLVPRFLEMRGSNSSDDQEPKSPLRICQSPLARVMFKSEHIDHQKYQSFQNSGSVSLSPFPPLFTRTLYHVNWYLFAGWFPRRMNELQDLGNIPWKYVFMSSSLFTSSTLPGTLLIVLWKLEASHFSDLSNLRRQCSLSASEYLPPDRSAAH